MFESLSAKYYQKNKGRHQNLTKEEKGKKRQYGRECFKNLSEDRKKYYIMRISTLL